MGCLGGLVFLNRSVSEPQRQDFSAKRTEHCGKKTFGIHIGRKKPAANGKGTAEAGWNETFSVVVVVCLQPTILAKR